MPPWNESIEAMLTILRRASAGDCSRPPLSHHLAKAWQRKNGAVRLIWITEFQSSSRKSTAGLRLMMPALLTSASTRPAALVIWATMSLASAWVILPKSAVMPVNLPPSEATFSAVSL